MAGPVSKEDSKVKIEELLAEFYGAPADFAQLGDFCSTDTVPAPFDTLLNHNEHMTVTVESFYGDKVTVDVHRTAYDGDWYAREITLATEKTGRIVQYGIVRLNTKSLDPVVWQRIESQEVPLGRVLIEHNVLREVQLCELWRVTAGQSLSELLHVPVGETVYGRTALIFCDGEPAIELLEIVTSQLG
ncbi:hypothetical protein [Planctomycetes bacterium K23_9]|uniref:Uncharacterized protein n=1 Tax=Stieleria marina TaxID=1930275 RepID=A0A517NRG5_9BACT|nr:hypothetical protein K239x_16520 [Planctomycetes bacterium K23_9]